MALKNGSTRRALVAGTIALLTLPASAALIGDFTTLPVPPDWHINLCIAASDTALWSCGTSGADGRATVFRIDLQGGGEAAFPLGAEFGSDPIVLALTPGADGAAWFIGAQLGPGSGPEPVPSGGAFLGQIDSNGEVFFTAILSAAFDNNYFPSISFDPASGVVAWTQIDGIAPSMGFRTAQGEIKAADFGAPGGPTSVALGKDGNFYFADASLTSIRIGKIPPNGSAATFLGEVDFPERTGPGGGEPPLIASAPDGDLYFTVAALAEICRITPTGTITHFTVQSAPGEIPSLVVGQDGNVYFGAPASGSVRRLLPSSGETEDFPLPANFATYTYNLLAPSPVSLAGDDTVLAAAFVGPGLLRLREAGSACPQVWQRNLAPIRLETRQSFFQELGVPPDKPIHVTGNPFGIVVQSHPQFFDIGGATPNPGQYTISVTVADPTPCPVDVFTIPIDVLAPSIRRVIPVPAPSPADVEGPP